ncbi:metallopeptidase family protein [Rhodococcus gannanensis]|uniref:Metallopeptidase family protein n=1 Tax=Rhodococcus gannanensis TaxID=1960308 RepID=A0ABW4P6X0_9NOCA
MHRARHGRPLTSRSAARRGRGIRGPVLPPGVPAWRSRAEQFDMLVLEAFAPIDARWHERMTKLDVAVDEVPKIRALDPDSVTWPPEVVAEGPVPLSRLVPAGVDRHGNATRARLVLFRRPLELRAKHPDELVDLLHEVLVRQVATYLGVGPEVIDPEMTDDPDD